MSLHALRARDYLGHMLGAVNQIQEYVRDRSREEFLSTKLLQDGVIRNIEILGEASRRRGSGHCHKISEHSLCGNLCDAEPALARLLLGRS